MIRTYCEQIHPHYNYKTPSLEIQILRNSNHEIRKKTKIKKEENIIISFFHNKLDQFWRFDK